MTLSATCSRAVPTVGIATLVLLLGPAATAAWVPDFEAPFLCGQDWQANTYPGHNPWFSVDFNRDDDYRAPVRAAAPGWVSVVADVGSTSYGRYIRVNHGNSWESLYAHLDASLVVVGQRVDQGAIIGLLGTSGGSTGPHLHFEQRLDGSVRHAVFHGRQLAYNTTITSSNCGDQPITGDWNGDDRTEVGVFRPRPHGNAFRLRAPGGRVQVVRLGEPGDLPVSGDWDGNGVTDVGVWNRLTHTFRLRIDATRTRTIEMGRIRDIPVAGDWNGNGVTDVGVFSPRRQSFRLRAANGTVTAFALGNVGSVPVTGDWDGDARTDIGVYDQPGSVWTFRDGDGSLRTTSFGGATAIPVTGDWTGDGTAGAGTWSPANAMFQLQRNANDVHLSFGLRRR